MRFGWIAAEHAKSICRDRRKQRQQHRNGECDESASHDVLSLSLYDFAPGGASFLNYSILSQHRGASQISERFPIAWNHVIDKESLKIKMLKQVLIEKVWQLFRNLL
jgi:hypothetical protein